MKKTLPVLLLLIWQSLVSQIEYLPAIKPSDQIVQHYAYTLCYSEQHEQAAWVAYTLTKSRVYGTTKRTDNFRPDPKVKTGSASLADYKSSGYDRGHLAPAADMKWSTTAMSESFYMSNMSPQTPGFNRGIWKKVEQVIRDWAVENEEIHVVTGPVLKGQFKRIGPDQVAVPNYYYKVVLDYKEPELKGIGLILPNESSSRPIQSYAVTIDQVEAVTGIDFFIDLPDNIEEQIESNLDLSKWSFSASHYSKPVAPGKSQIVPIKGDQIVYITKTGKKYHKDGCSSLSSSKIPIKLENAIKRGYGPCKKCWP